MITFAPPVVPEIYKNIRAIGAASMPEGNSFWFEDIPQVPALLQYMPFQVTTDQIGQQHVLSLNGIQNQIFVPTSSPYTLNLVLNPGIYDAVLLCNTEKYETTFQISFRELFWWAWIQQLIPMYQTIGLIETRYNSPLHLMLFETTLSPDLTALQATQYAIRCYAASSFSQTIEYGLSLLASGIFNAPVAALNVNSQLRDPRADFSQLLYPFAYSCISRRTSFLLGINPDRVTTCGWDYVTMNPPEPVRLPISATPPVTIQVVVSANGNPILQSDIPNIQPVIIDLTGATSPDLSIPCEPGDVFYGTCFCKGNGITKGTAHIGFRFDSPLQTGLGWGQPISNRAPDNTNSNLRTPLSVMGIAPQGAGIVQMYIELGSSKVSANVSASAIFDSIVFWKGNAEDPHSDTNPSFNLWPIDRNLTLTIYDGETYTGNYNFVNYNTARFSLTRQNNNLIYTSEPLKESVLQNCILNLAVESPNYDPILTPISLKGVESGVYKYNFNLTKQETRTIIVGAPEYTSWNLSSSVIGDFSDAITILTARDHINQITVDSLIFPYFPIAALDIADATLPTVNPVIALYNQEGKEIGTYNVKPNDIIVFQSLPSNPGPYKATGSLSSVTWEAWHPSGTYYYRLTGQVRTVSDGIPSYTTTATNLTLNQSSVPGIYYMDLS